jgi:trans-2-enoyl-CoA reductase
MRQLDAPAVIVVVGGSTGAGKLTLVTPTTGAGARTTASWLARAASQARAARDPRRQYVVESLEVVLWAFHPSGSFREAAL